MLFFSKIITKTSLYPLQILTSNPELALIMTEKNVNNVKRGTLANCIVLHDFTQQEPDVKAWFGYTIDFFMKNGLTPTRMGGTGKPSKTTSFEKAKKEHELNSFQEVLEYGLWFGATPPNHNNDSADSIFSTHLNMKKGAGNREVLVLCLDNDIVPFEPIIINQLTKALSAFFKPRYGYCYQRKFGQGPTWYPFGVISTSSWKIDEVSEEESELITKWLDTYHMPNGKYKTSDLRDIYPMNVLSQAHKDHVMEGKSFFDWIAEKSYRGSIYSLNENLWAWWVEPEHIPAVREELRPTGWVICI